MTDFFKFEKVKEDIPFYNGTPEVSTVGWIGLILGIIIYIIEIRFGHLVFSGSFIIDTFIMDFVPVLALLIPFLYVLKKRYSLFIKKINITDIVVFTIASLIFSYMLLIFVMGTGISPLELSVTQNQQNNVLDVLLLMFSLIGEELFKVILIILVMAFVYKFINNRKVALTIACVITLIVFGALHEGGIMGGLLKVIIVQGFGSIFDVMLYLRTKNILNSYISHVIFDLIPETIKLIIYFIG